jgi:hypothetical protein
MKVRHCRVFNDASMTQPMCVIDEMRLKGKAMTQSVRHWLSPNGASMTQRRTEGDQRR